MPHKESTKFDFFIGEKICALAMTIHASHNLQLFKISTKDIGSRASQSFRNQPPTSEFAAGALYHLV